MRNDYLEWLNTTPVLTYKNDNVLFTKSSIKSFVKSFKTKIEGKHGICVDDKELENLFFNLFIKESNEERGIVGNYSVSISKKEVFGSIFAIASLIDSFATGGNVSSVIISSGGLLYCLGSLINKLSKEELQLIGFVVELQRKTSKKSTVETIVTNFNEYTVDYILGLLHSLLKKDAIEWDGNVLSEIRVYFFSWFAFGKAIYKKRKI